MVKFGEVIDVKTESLPMIADETVIAKYKSSFLQNGDVIVADTAEDETVGKCTEIAGLSDEIVISGLHTIPYRPLQKYAPGYLGYYMNSASFHNQLLPLMQGIKVTSISKTALQNTDILYPKSATEQAAIGKYFRNLDNLITLHQRNSADFVSRFFSDFTNTWEQRKLGELTSLITKGTTPLDKSNIGTVNFVKIESIDNSSGEITITQKITSEEHEGYLRRSQLKENDILFSIAGTLGRVTSVKSSILPANTNQALAIIRLKSGCLKYVKTYLKGKAVADFIKKNPTIGAQPNLSLEQVSNIEIALPSEIEQAQIGSFFENLDHLITLHQCEYIFEK